MFIIYHGLKHFVVFAFADVIVSFVLHNKIVIAFQHNSSEGKKQVSDTAADVRSVGFDFPPCL